MNPGQQGRVVGFNEDSSVTRRLLEMGLTPGRHIEYVRNAPLRDPMEIKAGGCYLSLRHSEAALVTVEIDH
jgi:ferrous iron transport protein A